MSVFNFPRHKRVQFPRDTTQANNAYIGRDGELTLDMTRKEIRLHDGSKKGGWRIPSLTQIASLFLSQDSEAGGLDFGTNDVGFLVRVGDKEYDLRKLTTDDGLTITNPTGKQGDPKISLPDRLAVTSTAPAGGDNLVNLNDVQATGFYAIDSNAKNRPDSLTDGLSATLVVVKKDTKNITQWLTGLEDDMSFWTRSMTSGTWRAWRKIRPSVGGIKILTKGTDLEQRTWSAAQLNSWLTSRLKDLGDESSGGTFTSKMLFDDDIPGARIPDQVYGPFGSPTDGDRLVCYGDTVGTLVDGGVNFADQFFGGDLTLQLKIGGAWVTVFTMPEPTGEQNSFGSNAAHADIRFIFKTASVLVCNSDWVTTSTFAGAWDGEYKFQTNKYTTSLSLTGYRLRPST